jgi:8-oxo-dGTP pyrophosphatase MutT (NUDIX family)
MTGDEDLRSLVARALRARSPRTLELPDHARAAILVPLLDAADGPALLFTVRAPHLYRHAGQIAFPGGRLEGGEDDVQAALREAREEVGLELPRSAVLGRLDDHPSPFGIVARPLVACVPWPTPLRLDADEVSETFVVALADLRAVEPLVEERPGPGGARRLYGYDVAGRRIWGLTGSVVGDLLERLAAVEAPA